MFKSTASEAYTGKLSSSYKTNKRPPQLPINQSVEHKKGKINERCVVTVNWSWSPNGVWIGWPYYNLWLKYWIYVIYGFYTPMSQRSHLSFSPPNCPGKTKYYMWSKWECKSNKTDRKQDLREGFVSKLKTLYRYEINQNIKHFYDTAHTTDSTVSSVQKYFIFQQLKLFTAYLKQKHTNFYSKLERITQLI